MISTVFSQNIIVKANETTNRDVDELLTTIEPSMPVLNTRENQLNSTSTLSQRSEWITQVTQIQEEKYKQKVISVTENEDYIIFEFECNENLITNISPNNLNSDISSNNENINIQISSVYYLKPESSIYKPITNSSTFKTANSNIRANYSTKIIEYYGWIIMRYYKKYQASMV